jgi:hypothetical protein
MIYFIAGKQSQRVKIGKSKDPWSRMKILQSGSPDGLEMALLLHPERSMSALA